MIAHILKALISVQTASDGDWVDRLNHRFTAMILVILGILVSTKQYVGELVNFNFAISWSEIVVYICKQPEWTLWLQSDYPSWQP